MRGLAFAASALLVILCQLGVAQARDQLGDKDALVVQPGKSYIFYRTSQRQAVRLLREVSPAQRGAWEAQRASALARARAGYANRLRSWQRWEDECRGSQAPACVGREPRPVEPTEQTFAIPPPELDNFLDVNRGPQFTRADGAYTYLIAVDPGTYILYGQVIIGGNGNVGVCLCMGSVKFEAPAGRIVDLGEIHFPRLEGDFDRHGSTGPARLSSLVLVPPSAAMTRPERLTGQPVVPAQLRAADKMPNYFGIEIDRMPAIPGVLGYERDRVIDPSGSRPAP